MRRPWIVLLLIVLALVGAILIVTADEPGGPSLVEVTTAEGIVTSVPTGWVASEEFSFEFSRADEDHGEFDQWTVARACPQEGCGPRSLEEWLALADVLPTFVDLRSQDGSGVFGLEEEYLVDAQVSRAQTETAAKLVFVAAFEDGASSYVACSVRLAVGGDNDLLDAIVDVCRATEPVD